MNIIFLSETTKPSFIEAMQTRGSVILIPKDDRFDSRIASHPDLIISIVDGSIVIDEQAHQSIFQQLEKLGIPYITGNAHLTVAYPGDIAYNAVITKNLLIHKTEHTCPLILSHCNNTNKMLLPVRQGYTKCSTVVVSEDALITSDPSIYQAGKEVMKVLFVQPGSVSLPGYDSGFLGGASGLLGDTVVFHGDISQHPDFQQIADFVEEAQIKLLYFEEFPLTDIGSVLVYQHQKAPSKESSGYHKHVNIPVFISHEGCPNDCVFCNQRKITAKAEAMTAQEIKDQITTYCSTLEDQTYTELAFFGGSFTGIEAQLQEEYLSLAYANRKDHGSGPIQAIRLSTRPDYISPEILDRLRRYKVDIIELGVQSMEEEVLQASNRGHLLSDVYKAVSLIKSYGFQLGIQLMVGLPGDTKERSVLSAKLTALLQPDFVRIYPTLVIRDTELARLMQEGAYHPLSVDEAVDWTKSMYQVFLQAQIPVIRMGLQPTDLIAEGKEVLSGPFHPAFRQLVESAYFLDLIRTLLQAQTPLSDSETEFHILCNPRDLSQVIGHKRSNLTQLKAEYPYIRIIPDKQISPMKLELQYCQRH